MRAGRGGRAQPPRRRLPHRPRGARGPAGPAMGALSVHPGARVERRRGSGRRRAWWISSPATGSSARASATAGRAGAAARATPTSASATTASGSRAAAATASSCSSPRRVVHRLPESVALDAAVLIEPASVVLQGPARGPARAGGDDRRDRGRHARCARDRSRAALFAPAAIVAYGIREEELELARRLGATETVTVGGRRRSTEGEFDLVVETAGAVTALELATRLPREGRAHRAARDRRRGARAALPADRSRPPRPRADRQRRLHDAPCGAASSRLLGAGLVDVSRRSSPAASRPSGSRTRSR